MKPKDLTNFTFLIPQSLAPTIMYGVPPGSLSNLLVLFGVPMIMNSVLTVLRLSLFTNVGEMLVQDVPLVLLHF